MFAIGAGTSGFTAYVGFYEICKGRKFLFLVHVDPLDTLWGSMQNSVVATLLAALVPTKRFSFLKGCYLYIFCL